MLTFNCAVIEIQLLGLVLFCQIITGTDNWLRHIICHCKTALRQEVATVRSNSYVVILSPSSMTNTELLAGREGSDLKGSSSQLSADFLHNFLVILITQLNAIANSCKFSSTTLGIQNRGVIPFPTKILNRGFSVRIYAFGKDKLLKCPN